MDERKRVKGETMKTKESTRAIDLFFQPEYFNRTANCTIPECWILVVDVPKVTRSQPDFYPRVYGESPKQCIEIAKNEFPGIVGPKWILDKAGIKPEATRS